MSLKSIVGYDPNLLLTDQRSLTSRVCDLLYGDDDGEIPSLMRTRERTFYPPEMLVLGHGRLYFEHITHTKHAVTRWGESDTDPLDDLEAFYEHLVGDPGAPCHGKTEQAAERYVAVLHSDLSAVELAWLTAALRHETKPVILDFDPRGGEIPGLFADDSVLYRKPHYHAVEPLRKQPPSYMKHDRTKQHGRHGSLKRRSKRTRI